MSASDLRAEWKTMLSKMSSFMTNKSQFASQVVNCTFEHEKVVGLFGGAVRDILIDEKPKDYDFIIQAKSNHFFVQFSEEIVSLYQSKGWKVFGTRNSDYSELFNVVRTCHLVVKCPTTNETVLIDLISLPSFIQPDFTVNNLIYSKFDVIIPFHALTLVSQPNTGSFDYFVTAEFWNVQKWMHKIHWDGYGFEPVPNLDENVFQRVENNHGTLNVIVKDLLDRKIRIIPPHGREKNPWLRLKHLSRILMRVMTEKWKLEKDGVFYQLFCLVRIYKYVDLSYHDDKEKDDLCCTCSNPLNGLVISCEENNIHHAECFRNHLEDNLNRWKKISHRIDSQYIFSQCNECCSSCRSIVTR